MADPSKTDVWLDRVFGAGGARELARSYDEWAESYDVDMLAIGYLNPAIVCSLVARHVVDLEGPILDAGCGTGLMGEILATLGYRQLVGLDMSNGMLERARARRVYRELHRGVLGARLEFEDGAFAAVIASGVFTAGHAPADALDELLRITRRGGHLILAFASSAWEGEVGLRAKTEALEGAGRWRLAAATQPYRPMPLSQSKGGATTRSMVFDRL
jgi:SAM-dependent methyltransferase